MGLMEKWVNLFTNKDKLTLKVRVTRFLTPKNTEQVRNNLFIQRRKGDDLIETLHKIQEKKFDEIRYPKYRQITPAAWNNKINWVTTILGAHPIKSTLIFIMILFLAWSYQHDISSLTHLINQFKDNPELCYEYYRSQTSFNLSGFNVTNFTLP